MLDLGASELLLIVIVAVIVIGPKDLPLALRTAGKWIGKLRRLSGHFRTGLDAMIREAEMDEMEKKWKTQNEQIMRQDPATLPVESEPTGALPARPAMIAPGSSTMPATEPVSVMPVPIDSAAPQSMTAEPSGTTSEERAPDALAEVHDEPAAESDRRSPRPGAD